MSTRLYVSNLPLSATEGMLITRFCKYGNVVSALLVSVYLALAGVPGKPS